MRFAKDDTELDDRIFVFFAGHGRTRHGQRGDVGFLVAHDWDPNDAASDIRWDELTRNSDFIRAKHVLFVMDACYGGLALTRGLHVGSARFVKDMMIRYARQVLTAGKADEVVADSGGPLPNHSVFTGHLIGGLRGKAATANGVITANGLMAYVYQCVANDHNSNQTPHYGYFDGDGDFVFAAPQFIGTETEKKDIDELIVIPFVEEELTPETIEQKIATVKTLLSDQSLSIKLHDFLMHEVRRYLSETNEANFPTRERFSPEELTERFSKYESSVRELAAVLACTAYWGKTDHQLTLQKMLARSTDRLVEEEGLWLQLRWYPMVVMFYFCGIAAVAARRYDSLACIFDTTVMEREYFQKERPLVQSVGRRIPRLKELFEYLKGYEQKYAPLSEHLFKTVQPTLDDVLFIGRDYESFFDEFELLFALVLHHLKDGSGTPSSFYGRFAWKYDDGENSPFHKLKNKVEVEGDRWGPIRNGLFGGSVERFRETALNFETKLSKLNWS
jgi:hypothetical protein